MIRLSWIRARSAPASITPDIRGGSVREPGSFTLPMTSVGKVPPNTGNAGVLLAPDRGLAPPNPMRMKLTLISHWGAAPGPLLFWFFCGVATKKPEQKHFSGGCNPQSPALPSGRPLNFMRMGFRTHFPFPSCGGRSQGKGGKRGKAQIRQEQTHCCTLAPHGTTFSRCW